MGPPYESVWQKPRSFRYALAEIFYKFRLPYGTADLKSSGTPHLFIFFFSFQYLIVVVCVSQHPLFYCKQCSLPPLIAIYTTLSLTRYRQAAAAVSNDNRNGQEALLFPPPEGPNSAYLILQEDEDEDHMDQHQNSCCWGCCEDNRVRELPFPQDKCLSFKYTQQSGQQSGQHSHTYVDRVYLIPVLGQPISSHSYHVVRAEGKHKGLVETCSREEDMTTLCWCRCVNDTRPRSLELGNPYQQMQIIRRKRGFTAACIASDGFPPQFLRRKGWRVTARELRGKHGRLAHVRGENPYLRSQLPSLNFPIGDKESPPVTVGEWYCPFIFIKESGGDFEEHKNQAMQSPFYKMSLQKFWEEIYRNEGVNGVADVTVEKTVRVEEVLLLGKETAEMVTETDGSVWIKTLKLSGEDFRGVRLSRPIIEKMRTDQRKLRDYFGGGDVRVNRSFGGSGTGRKFACYVAVERYVLKRMDGSVVMTYSFRDCNQIEGKWE